MNIKDLLKDIDGVFVPPVRKYYIGKIKHGTPYFSPIGFNPFIVSIRRLIEKTEEQKREYAERYPHLKNQNKFVNLPMVRRSKDWIVKLFGRYYWIQIGWPVAVKSVDVGWKWKYDSIRAEWVPSFQVYFFCWQFCIHWVSPDGDDDDYYEQVLWWIKACGKDLKKAEDTWGWVDSKTKLSTWGRYLKRK